MSKLNSHTAFNKLDELSFPEEIYPVYELIKKYPKRISFVKDHNGMKNVLFIATQDEADDIYEVPYFSIFTHGDTANDSASFSEILHSSEEIYKKTEAFLKERTDTLYVGIGFAECKVTNDDYFEMLYLLEETRCNVLDAFVSLRRFPDWFAEIADYPYYIIRQEQLLSEMVQDEREHLSKTKEKLLLDLNKAVSANNKDDFNKLCLQLNHIRNQIKGY